MYRYNVRSYWNFVKLKNKIAVYKRMYRKVLRKLQEKELQAYRASDGFRDNIGQHRLPVVTISSQTEIGQAEESIKVPKQRAYTGRKPVISSSLANTPCSSLGIEGLLDLLNTTLGTSYTLDIPSVSSVLKNCIAQKYDFGTAYGHLRSAWCGSGVTDIQMELRQREAEDRNWRRDKLRGSRIVNVGAKITPRRVWDLYSNRVVPWWSCQVDFKLSGRSQPISHAWVDEADRVDVRIPINGYEWPVPIPKGANLDLIRIEMLNLGAEYTWLDVLCLRQRGGPREDLRVKEWELDVPTIGAIYDRAYVVCYLSGLGLPLSLKEGDLENERSWFRRAWTVQEVGLRRTIAGDTPDGPMHAEPIDDTGNYKDEILTKFDKQLKAAVSIIDIPYAGLSRMQDRVSTYPVDKVAGLAFCLKTESIPAYYESQSLEDAWTALINELDSYYLGILFFTYPEPGTGCKKWRPSWEQVMTKPLPNDSKWIDSIGRDDDDWCKGFHIESGFVRGLAVRGEEGIDRCGELVVEDAVGMAHSFDILASHQYPIPDGTYTLLQGTDPSFLLALDGEIRSPQYWVVGRRLPSKVFEKVSVFKMTDSNEIKRLKELGVSAESRSILA